MSTFVACVGLLGFGALISGLVLAAKQHFVRHTPVTRRTKYLGVIGLAVFLLAASVPTEPASPSESDRTKTQEASSLTAQKRKAAAEKRAKEQARLASINKKERQYTEATFPFKNKRQLKLGSLDDQNRATYAHIQLQEKHKPHSKRDKEITYNPAGWHNYKFYYGDGTQKAWLMTRGHLISYQFSGLNTEAKNLTAETNWLNAGNYQGLDEKNHDAILFYETGLDKWLHQHPNHWLDYKVTPIYQGSELYPRKIELQYVGIDSAGNLIPIKLNSPKETTVDQFLTVVSLDNVSPNANIDYASGQATNTVARYSAPQPETDNETVAGSSSAISQPSVAAQPAPNQAVQAQPAQADLGGPSGNVNNTSIRRWEVQDGFTWQTRKGHSHIIPPGGTLDPGFHWEVGH